MADRENLTVKVSGITDDILNRVKARTSIPKKAAIEKAVVHYWEASLKSAEAEGQTLRKGKRHAL